MPADDDLQLNHGHVVPAAALEWRFDRSGGPGGQNVNKTSTQATLTVTLADLSVLLPGHAIDRLQTLPTPAVHADRVVIQASDSRSQWQNRAEAKRKLRALLNLALQRDKPRIATRVPRSARRRRIENKRYRGQLKRQRQPPARD
jgi:ribosome-associated protein